MNTKDMEGFRYSDMKACLVDIHYGYNITATFRIFLPPNADDNRIYQECERIPIDIMFRYLVAIHYDLTVLDVTARVAMAGDGEDDDSDIVSLDKFAIYATCRCFYCQTYLNSLVNEARLFVGSSDQMETIHTSTFMKTLPVATDKENNTIFNGIFHVSTNVCSEVPPYTHLSRMRPYGLDIHIKCVNMGALKQMGFNYDIYEHNGLYSVINDIIKETVAMLINWMIYETTEGFKPYKDMLTHITYHFIHCVQAGSPEKKDRLSVSVVIIPDGLFGLMFAYAGANEMACLPIDMNAKRAIQFHDMDYGIPQKTLDPIMRRMESMHSYLMSTAEYTYVAQCTSICRKPINEMMHFLFKFEPAVINWGTGILNKQDSAFTRIFDTTMCDYLICRSFEGFDIAFPMNGQNPRRGVLFYMRYSQHLGLGNIKQAFPLTRKVPIYARTISCVEGYVVLEFAVDGLYDQDIIGMGDADKYFPSHYFPTINDDLMTGSRGKLEDWINLSDENKDDTIKFLMLLTRYMFIFQINESVMMNCVGTDRHAGILESWMNCVGLPLMW